jgi:hypothetical protein
MQTCCPNDATNFIQARVPGFYSTRTLCQFYSATGQKIEDDHCPAVVAVNMGRQVIVAINAKQNRVEPKRTHATS